mmetsp:Transcript_70793/g.163671  ORF Transcript_70793/g.163671 Transcript_70793/m.163671 type:complete len:552 (+) Transcript_70793:71-1726(+)
MGLSTTRAAVLLALSLGAALADKRAQVTDACVEGDCSADPHPLKGQSILQVNSLDPSSAPVPADLVEEEDGSEVKPHQVPKKGARSGDKKRKSVKGKVLLQTEASSPSKGAPVKEDKLEALHKQAQDVRNGEEEIELPMPIPNPMAVHEEVLVSPEAPTKISHEEEQEILKHIKRAEDIGLFDRKETKSTHPELAEIDKMEAWAKFEGLGQLGDGQKAYEKVQDKGRTSEYLKAREYFENKRKKAAKKSETRKARANALVQMTNKKSKAQLSSEDKFHLAEEGKFANNVHICEEEEKEIKARIEQAKAAGAIQPPTKESLKNIKEQVRHAAILQQTKVLDAKAHNAALLQKNKLALLQMANGTVSGSEDASHGKSGQDVLDAIAAAAEEELTAEEQKATEESTQEEKLLPPEDALPQGLLQNESAESAEPVVAAEPAVADDMRKFIHMKAEHDTQYQKEFLNRVAEAANTNFSVAEEAADQESQKSNRMLPPEAHMPNSELEETAALEDAAVQRIATNLLQADKNLQGKAGIASVQGGPPGRPASKGPPTR